MKETPEQVAARVEIVHDEVLKIFDDPTTPTSLRTGRSVVELNVRGRRYRAFIDDQLVTGIIEVTAGTSFATPMIARQAARPFVPDQTITPTCAKWLLSAVTSPTFRDTLLGDLEEDFHKTLKHFGPKIARRRCISTAIHSAGPLLWSRVTQSNMAAMFFRAVCWISR